MVGTAGFETYDVHRGEGRSINRIIELRVTMGSGRHDEERLDFL